MLERENMYPIGENSIIDRVGKTWHQIAADILFKDSPPLGCSLDYRDRLVSSIQKLNTKSRNPILVIQGRAN